MGSMLWRQYLPKLNLLITASPNHARLRWLRVNLWQYETDSRCFRLVTMHGKVVKVSLAKRNPETHFRMEHVLKAFSHTRKTKCWRPNLRGRKILHQEENSPTASNSLCRNSCKRKRSRWMVGRKNLISRLRSIRSRSWVTWSRQTRVFIRCKTWEGIAGNLYRVLWILEQSTVLRLL